MAKHYDKAQEFYRYVSSHERELMTPLERRAEWLGMLREKATHSKSETLRKVLLAKYDAEPDAKAKQLTGNDLDGLRTFQAHVAARIQSEIADGRLAINRCPSCNRIVKTPRARQCLWCGHDWHER